MDQLFERLADERYDHLVIKGVGQGYPIACDFHNAGQELLFEVNLVVMASVEVDSTGAFLGFL